jgi:hypothetical protein
LPLPAIQVPFRSSKKQRGKTTRIIENVVIFALPIVQIVDAFAGERRAFSLAKRFLHASISGAESFEG